MMCRGISLVISGVVVLGLGGCGSTSTKAGNTTIPPTGITTRVATSTTANATIGGASTTLTTASTSTVQTGSTTTTAAGRVVTKPNDSVHRGDTGPGVTLIQKALVAWGYKVTVDGKFGAQTEQSVKDFQSKNGLKQDGIVGPATWAKLQAAPTATTTKATTTTTVKRTTTT